MLIGHGRSPLHRIVRYGHAWALRNVGLASIELGNRWLEFEREGFVFQFFAFFPALPEDGSCSLSAPTPSRDDITSRLDMKLMKM